jgi:hypothetical protein
MRTEGKGSEYSEAETGEKGIKEGKWSEVLLAHHF